MEKRLIIESNNMLRSLYGVIERKGTNTDWESLEKQVSKILKEQHEYLFLGPHEVSQVECDLCSKEWTAVRPKGVTHLECPECKNMTII